MSLKESIKSFYKEHKVLSIIIILIILSVATQNNEEPDFVISKYTSSCNDACAKKCRYRDFDDGYGDCISCGEWITRLENKQCDCHCW